MPADMHTPDPCRIQTVENAVSRLRGHAARRIQRAFAMARQIEGKDFAICIDEVGDRLPGSTGAANAVQENERKRVRPSLRLSLTGSMPLVIQPALGTGYCTRHGP